MLSDIDNMRKMMELLGDEGFVDALTNAEKLVEDVDETLERVEQIEGEAEQAVREANGALLAVDHRLEKFDEAIRLIEAKIEAGFSIGFFFFALQQWTAGEPLIAAGLFAMGLLGISSLMVTIATMPQVRRLRQVSKYLTDRRDEEDADDQRDRQPTEPLLSDNQRGQQRSDRQRGQQRSDRNRKGSDSAGDNRGK